MPRRFAHDHNATARRCIRPGFEPLEDRLVPATFIVDTLSDNPNDGLTLREAIRAANMNGSGVTDVIQFASGLAGGTIRLLDDPFNDFFFNDGLVLTTPTDIQGIAGNLITVEGMFTTASVSNDVITVNSDIVASISDLRIRSPLAGNGDGIVNNGTLTLTRVVIADVRTGSGVGFRNFDTATLETVTITGNVNTDEFSPAGVFSDGNRLTIRNSTITNNRADGENGLGGGVYHEDGVLEIADTVIRGNTARLVGGGLGITAIDSDVTVTLTRVRVENNTALIGGGVAIVGVLPEPDDTPLSTTVTIVDSTISGNTADSTGGVAISANDDRVAPTVQITNTTVSDNAAAQNATGNITVAEGGFTFNVPRGQAGGIGISRGQVTIIGGTVSGNLATLSGGIGIDAGTLTVTGTRITGNSADAGGGLVAVKATGTPTVTVTGATISGNSVPTNATGTIKYSVPGIVVPEIPRGIGGGVANAGATMTIVNSTIDGNRATGAAGVALAEGTLTLTGTTISRNRAIGSGETAAGGGIGMLGGTLNMTNSTIDSNSAPLSGGFGIGKGMANIAFSTITSNSASVAAGGLATQGTVNIRSSVVASNTAPGGIDVAGRFNSQGNNFIGIGDGGTGFSGSDRVGTTALPLFPLLAPLANNGGPTETRLPLPSSPLIDAAGGNVPGTDQRGVVRPVGVRADIGAVERRPDDPVPPSTPQLPRTYSVGPDVGGGSIVRSFNADGSERLVVDAGFPAGFTGGVRVAEADFNGDGIADIAVGTGPGIATLVRVLDGRNGAELFSIAPFEASFTGGVYIAAGDLTADGIAELVITPDEGGGPRVQVFLGRTFTLIADFFGIDDPNFRGGARTAIGDVNGDGVGDLIVAAGFGGGPRIAVFNGVSILSGTPVKLFNDFFAFEETLRNGVYIAAGDVNGDGFADLILGGGPGGGPRVRIADGLSLVNGVAFGLPDTPPSAQLANFFAGDVNNRGGIRLSTKNLDNDNQADLVVGAGSGAGSLVTAYLGKSITPDATPPAFTEFEAFPSFSGGVFVG